MKQLSIWKQLFKERCTFNRSIKEIIEKEILKYHIKNKNDCFKVGQQLGSMMREVVDEISEQENFDENMRDRFIVGLRSSV